MIEGKRLALAAIVDELRNRPRGSPVEPPEPVAGAYPKLIVALSVARLGDADRARALMAEALEDLARANYRHDAVHALLVDACTGAIERALANDHTPWFMPAPLRARLPALSSTDGYRVLRFVQALPVPDARGMDVIELHRVHAPMQLPPIPDSAVEHGAAALPTAIATLRRLAQRDELAKLIANERADTFDALGIVVAGARSYLGDPRGDKLLAKAEATFTASKKINVDLIRTLAPGYAVASTRVALEAHARLRPLVARTSDVFGTSSHFAHDLVHLVASLCSIIDELADDGT
jgi:hypothetical protein